MLSVERISVLQSGCLVVGLFSICAAINYYPSPASRLGVALGIIAFVSIFLRVGWFVPFTIAGIWAGIISTQWIYPIVSDFREYFTPLVVGTVFGFAIGAMIDLMKPSHPKVQDADGP